MAAKAYVLIQAKMGQADAVRNVLRGLPGVREVETITGPYDVIAVVEGADLDAVGALVKNRVQGVSGIDRTMTCLAVG